MNHPDTPSWDRLVSTALVGTSRRPVPDLPDLPRRPGRGAAALLDLAALDTVRTRAGYTAHTAEPVTPDAPDPRPETGPAATRRLDAVLTDRPELLPEWLSHVARSGRRVNHAQIPDLLERAARDSGLRSAVATVVGDRGTWLAGFNRTWSFVAGEPLPTDTYSDASWNDGTPAERRRALFALRATDPAAARSLLTAAWPRESRGEERRGLLQALAVNLGPDDAGLLDAALDDRGANVRGLALALLTRLPDSTHAHRLRGHLREHVRLDATPRCPVEVTATDPRRTDLLRDLALVTPGNRPQTRDERWEHSRVLVTHTPLDVWTGLLDTDPAGVLALAEHEKDLYEALADAACVQADPDWSRAVLDHPRSGPAHLVRHGAQHPQRQRLRALLAPLPATERCARVLAAIGPGEEPPQLGEILLAVGAPWTRELSEEVVRRLAAPADPHGRGDPRGYRLLCEAAAGRMPPEHLDLLPAEPPRAEEGPAYLRLRETLRFRLDMHREL
ncbi:DUF5691 domain-containing protein [Nocardiopsis terrae]